MHPMEQAYHGADAEGPYIISALPCVLISWEVFMCH